MRIRNTGKPSSSEKLESYDVFETICDPQLVIDPGHLMQIRNTDLYLYWHFDYAGRQCCGSGSGIRCFFDPWIRDPEYDFPDPGSRIPYPKPIFLRAW
jgi:hypothetical protein